MTLKTLQPILAEHPFFSGMRPEFVELLTGCARNERYESGSFIFRQGETADKFYIIRQGAVSLEISGMGRGAIGIDRLGAGDILGWSWLIPPYLFHSDARALTLTRAVSIDARCLRTKCDADHSLGYEMMRRFLPVFAERIKHTEMQLLDVYGERS